MVGLLFKGRKDRVARKEALVEKVRITVCPRRLVSLRIYSKLLYKMGDDFLDIKLTTPKKTYIHSVRPRSLVRFHSVLAVYKWIRLLGHTVLYVQEVKANFHNILSTRHIKYTKLLHMQYACIFIRSFLLVENKLDLERGVLFNSTKNGKKYRFRFSFEYKRYIPLSSWSEQKLLSSLILCSCRIYQRLHILLCIHIQQGEWQKNCLTAL